MSPRARRLQRLAAAQEAIARNAVVTHQTIRAEHLACAQSADEIVAALCTDSPLHGLLTPVIASALNRNAADSHRLATAADLAAQKERVERAKADALAARAQTAQRLENRRRDRRLLEDLVSTHPRPARR